MRNVMPAERHRDVLGLEEDLVAPRAAFAPDAAGLGAAEGLAQVAHVLAVDEAHPGLDRRGDAVRAAQVLGEDVARQAVGATWLPRHRKMKPFPATAPQEKSHV